MGMKQVVIFLVVYGILATLAIDYATTAISNMNLSMTHKRHMKYISEVLN